MSDDKKPWWRTDDSDRDQINRMLSGRGGVVATVAVVGVLIAAVVMGLW